jgi:hypothetical protein
VPDSDKHARRAPVVVEPQALIAHQRRTAITLHTLGDLDRQRAIEFFASHLQARDAFIRAVSRFFPLSAKMIERYEDRWYWEGLSWNEGLPWTTALIERYEDRWN